MKSNFHEVRERQFPMLPAEACSELGYAGETRQQPIWIARWLQVTRANGLRKTSATVSCSDASMSSIANSRSNDMESLNSMKMENATGRKSSILYPMMLVAAIAVIIFSVLGIATMTGYMPSALSRNGPDAKSEPAAKNEATTAPAAKPVKPRLAAANGAGCADCGVVESIRVVESKGQGSGLGAVAGGVVGGILGNQIGGGGGVI